MKKLAKLKKPLTLTQRRKAEWKAALKQYDVVLKDAKANLPLQVIAQDNKGKMLDPAFCAFVRAAKREYGAEVVFVGNKVAGIIRKVRGQYVAERYVLPQAVMIAIKAFDKGNKMPPATYTFLAPTGGRTLAAQKAAGKKAHKSWKALAPKHKAKILAKRARRKANKRSGATINPVVHTRGFGDRSLAA